MKELVDNWRGFIQKEGLSSGTVSLYHFSKVDSDTLELDPEFFKTKRSHYSRNDYNVSSFPRVFFYVDPAEAENIVKSSNPNLFVTQVNSSDIYNLMEDPEDLLNKSKKAMSQVRADFTKIFKSLTLTDKPHPDPQYAKYFVPIREDGSKKYKGVYYTINGGQTQVVVWFDKIKVNKKESEDK